MNLAQIVDPTRLRDSDPLARKPAPMAPMGVVTRENGISRAGGPLRPLSSSPLRIGASSKGIWDAMRTALANGERSGDEIFGALQAQYDKAAYRNSIQALVRQGDVQRIGRSRYALTEKGRSQLKEQQGGNGAAGADG